MNYKKIEFDEHFDFMMNVLNLMIFPFCLIFDVFL